MRNLKKLLALMLATAMVLSVGSIASAKPVSEFSDYESYKDISADYLASTQLLVDLGAVIGGGGDTLNLNGTLTRAEMATILYRLMNAFDMPAGVKSSMDKLEIFTDVAPGTWFAPFVNWASTLGYMSGKGNNQFAPYDLVTGIEAVVLMSRILGLRPELDADFVGKLDWAQMFPLAMLKSQLLFNIPGKFDGDLTEALTRGEIFHIFKAALDAYPILSYNDRGIPLQAQNIMNTIAYTQGELVYAYTKVTGTIIANEFIHTKVVINTADSAYRIGKPMPDPGYSVAKAGKYTVEASVPVYPGPVPTLKTFDFDLPAGCDSYLDKYELLNVEVYFYAKLNNNGTIAELYGLPSDTGNTARGGYSNATSAGGDGTNPGSNGLWRVAFDIGGTRAFDNEAPLFLNGRVADNTWGDLNPSLSDWKGVMRADQGRNTKTGTSIIYAFNQYPVKVHEVKDNSIVFAPLGTNQTSSYTGPWVDTAGTLLSNTRREIALDDILEGADLVAARDDIAGLIPVGNGKYVLTEATKVENVTINAISISNASGERTINGTYKVSKSTPGANLGSLLMLNANNDVTANALGGRYNFVIVGGFIVDAEFISGLATGIVVAAPADGATVRIMDETGEVTTFTRKNSGELPALVDLPVNVQGDPVAIVYQLSEDGTTATLQLATAQVIELDNTFDYNASDAPNIIFPSEGNNVIIGTSNLWIFTYRVSSGNISLVPVTGPIAGKKSGSNNTFWRTSVALNGKNIFVINNAGLTDLNTRPDPLYIALSALGGSRYEDGKYQRQQTLYNIIDRTELSDWWWESTSTIPNTSNPIRNTIFESANTTISSVKIGAALNERYEYAVVDAQRISGSLYLDLTGALEIIPEVPVFKKDNGNWVLGAASDIGASETESVLVLKYAETWVDMAPADSNKVLAVFKGGTLGDLGLENRTDEASEITLEGTHTTIFDDIFDGIEAGTWFKFTATFEVTTEGTLKLQTKGGNYNPQTPSSGELADGTYEVTWIEQVVAGGGTGLQTDNTAVDAAEGTLTDVSIEVFDVDDASGAVKAARGLTVEPVV